MAAPQPPSHEPEPRGELEEDQVLDNFQRGKFFLSRLLEGRQQLEGGWPPRES